MKDMGKVMAALRQGYAGKMDFGKASGLVKALLAAIGVIPYAAAQRTCKTSLP